MHTKVKIRQTILAKRSVPDPNNYGIKPQQKLRNSWCSSQFSSMQSKVTEANSLVKNHFFGLQRFSGRLKAK